MREQKARVGKPAEPQSEAAFRELQSVLARRGLALSAVLYRCLCSREASAAIFLQSLATATSGGLSQYAVGQAA